MSTASLRTWSGAMPARPKNVTGSTPVLTPPWETVSILQVCPDLMRNTGGMSAAESPQITVSGVERSVASGVRLTGTGCAAAAVDRPKNTALTSHPIHVCGIANSFRGAAQRMAQDLACGHRHSRWYPVMMALIALQSLVRVRRGRGFNGQHHHPPARR